MNEQPLNFTGRASCSGGVGQVLPLSLYVHLPWCLRKCPYCDFNSHEAGAQLGQAQQAQYVDALLADIERALPDIWGRSVQTIFFGGGTPSLFEPEQIDRLISGIRARVRLAANAEITLEANPGTFEAQRFEAFAQAGVTRLSIGVQSFDNNALTALGRVHDAQQALAAVEVAQRCFQTFNLDMMFALPGQSMAGLQRDLDEVHRIAPPHWSCYHLTLEPNTLFAHAPPAGLPDDELAADMLDAVQDAAGAMQMSQYEVSAYAHDGHRCRHNLNYWSFGDYLGIGAGAHSKLSFHDRIIREQRYRHPQRYMQAARGGAEGAVEQTRVLGRDDLVFEFMLNALRLVDGVESAVFAAHTGLALSEIGRRVDDAVAAGLMHDDPLRLKPTRRGLQLLNDLQMRFLGD